MRREATTPSAQKAVMPEPPPWLDVPDEAEALLHETTESLPMPATEPAPASIVATPPPQRAAAPIVEVRTTPLGDRWARAVAELNQRQAVSALARELAMQAELIDITEGDEPVWRLRVERESLRTTGLRDKLRAALVEVLGSPVRLEVEAGTAQDSPARRDAAERQRLQRQAEDIIQSDPLVLELMAQFKTARIVPGSIRPHQLLSPQEHKA